MKRIVLAAMVACLATMGGGTVQAQSAADKIQALERKVADLVIISKITANQFKTQQCQINDLMLANVSIRMLQKHDFDKVKNVYWPIMTDSEKEQGCQFVATRRVLK